MSLSDSVIGVIFRFLIFSQPDVGCAITAGISVKIIQYDVIMEYYSHRNKLNEPSELKYVYEKVF